MIPGTSRWLAAAILFHLSCFSYAWSDDRPVLNVRNGHLFVTSAKDRNITLESVGASYVTVNGIDMTQAAVSAKEAAQFVERWRYRDLPELQRSVDQLTENYQTLVNAEFGPSHRTPTAGGASSAQLQQLSADVNQLKTQVASIMRRMVADECASNPCLNGGTCEDMIDKYICRCTEGWEGPQCNNDINECAIFAGTDLGCQNGAECKNRDGGYDCICKGSWHGIHCTLQSAVCSNANSRDLCGNGVCVPTPSKSGANYTCICEQGWEHGTFTEACTKDVDECAGKHPPCSIDPHVHCVNLIGSYSCNGCPAGYTGNGFQCTDINECLVNNGGCSISPLVTCINKRGTRECAPCPPGYSGNGEFCMYLGACNINNGGCHPVATCIHTPGMIQGMVQCRCPPGYMGDGMGPNGCWSSGGNFGQSACSSSPCSHGTCKPIGTSNYRCQCDAGYTGKNCNTRHNPCEPNPCRNDGTCRVSANGNRAICRCTSQFSGPRCARARQSCGGTLSDSEGTLQFPSSGNVYQNGLSCAWVLTTNSSLVLNVTFIAFNLELSDECQNDFVQIHDGRTAGDHMIGKYCGNRLPNGTGTIISSRHTLYLWFHSDHSISQDGFTLQWKSIRPLCGGEITAEHGTLRSPGSPGKYPPNRDCDWHVETSPGKKLKFHFYSMSIEERPNCDHDNLTIRSGPEEDSQLLGLYCNHTNPPPLITPENEAWLHFHSDSTVQDDGFQITFSSEPGVDGCGGIYTDPSGYITSPNFIEEYKENHDCEWKIQVPNGERIKITWVTVDLEDSRNCRFDYVELFDGDSRESPSMGKFCGHNSAALPPEKLSTSNIVLIRFVSDYAWNGKGFHLRYEVGCGGQFTEPTGVIKSPYYPNQYPKSKTCIYEIIQPVGKAIELTIQSMDIEDLLYPSCPFDYLRIHDGDNENSTVIGTYCGSNSSIPASPIISTHNYMWIKFRSDSSYQERGFLATYTTVDIRCGGIYKEPTGLITSPAARNWYGESEDCTWIIQATPGMIVKLDWHSFNLEDSSGCQFDYVRISQNLSSTTQLDMGRYCGSTVPLTMLTQSRTMTIQYHTDESVTKDGFSASYIFLDGSKFCGGNFHSLTGVITSPNYPNRYPDDRNCEWVIIAPSRHQVVLNVTAFDLEEHTSCGYDYLEIRNGGLESSPLIGKFCGTQIVNQIFQSFSNKIYLKFVSDRWGSTEPGFRIEWNSNTIGCGGTLNSVTGSISSPNYPQPYYHYAVCTWNIQVAAGSLIQFVIVDVELEDHYQCDYDYIEIFEGPNSSRDKKLGRYCNSNIPLIINTTTNIATVRFRSDFSGSGRGFHINYRAVCHRTLHDFRGVIESPNFPNDYPNHANCSWIIKAPMGNKLNITFSHFELEEDHGHDSCLFDYLTIKEGEHDTPDELLGTYCGSRQPPSKIVSKESHVFLQFVTDGSIPHNGFRLEWVVNGCGGVLNKPVGTITSPGYPGPYPPSIECNWQIEVDYAHSIEITFVDVKLETVKDCHFDKLTVYGGASTDAPVLITTCGMNSSSPDVFTSSNNKMLIKFEADHNYEGLGFKITYRSVNIQCGGRFTTPTGVISSPNYGQNYPHNLNCEWLIQMPRHHHVNLTFTNFDIEATTNCTDDYVRIYDGATRDLPILGSYCGNVNPPTQISYDNELLVVLRTDPFVSKPGFSATYKMACGGRIIADPEGSISIDSLLGLDTDVYNCTWIIVAPDLADHVTVTLTHLQLSNQYSIGDCEQHSIKIYEGEGTDGPLLKTLCSTTVPPPIISQGNALTIQLSAYELHLSSFTAMYSTLNSACGGNYTSEHGTIATPGYPANYPANAECVWTLAVSPGNSISLTFVDFAITENPNCNSDYLEVRKENAIGNLEGIYCTSSTSNIISNKTLWLKFESSNITTAKGFSAEYHLLRNNELTGLTGEVTSPQYPQPCMLDGDYSYRITVDFAQLIRITFEKFHLETYSVRYCTTSLVIYDGYDEHAPKLFDQCGLMLPGPVQSTGNVVYIVFSTNVVKIGSWFHLNWLQVPSDIDEPSVDTTECSELISLTSSVNNTYLFHSPGWPDGYGDNIDCSWIFESLPGTHLGLAFYTIDLEDEESCLYDKVYIYSGNSLTAQGDWSLIGRYCHPNIPHNLIKTSNLMKVVFQTDGWYNKTGFSARVYKGCGGQLYGPNGVIEANSTTPSMWQREPMQCQWNVTVRPGRMIEVTITELNIETSNGNSACSDHYLMLKNGGTSASPLLGNGKYCGQNVPGILTTTGNQLYVYVVGMKSATRVKLSYREVGIDCGGSYRLTNALKTIEIKSPNYPNIPHPYTECFWTIMAPAGQEMMIHFDENFDLTTDPNCVHEYLEIRDGAIDSSPPLGLGQFCGSIPKNSMTPTGGSRTPSSMTTTGNFMYLHFYTDVDNPRQGFQAVVTIENTCGGTLRGRNMKIRSPNHPGPYPISTVCSWRVFGLPGHTMKLQFEDINLPSRYRCNLTDHVDISGQVGNNRSDVLQIGQYCGSNNPGVIDAPTNVMINFTSTATRRIEYRGFSMNISSSLEACGGPLTGSSGEFQSPGYPDREVTKYRQCLWLITAPEGYRIKVEILDIGLGSQSSRSYRTAAMILFYNDLGRTSRIRLIMPQSSATEIYSTSNTMAVSYWASSVIHKGFKARYSRIVPALCGSATTDNQGVLISNQNPVYGMRNFSCNWKVSSPTVTSINRTLALTISGVIGSSTPLISIGRCKSSKSFIAVNADNEMISCISGNLTEDTIIRSPMPVNEISISKSPWSAPLVNFTMNYRWHQCGGILGGPSNTISAPKSQVHPIDCAWYAKFPDNGESLILNFTRLNISCDSGYIRIRHGGPLSPLDTRKFCGHALPDNITSSSNKLWIEYHSSASSNDFEIQLNTIQGGCGGLMHGSSSYISSPMFPQDYPNNAECLWFIEVDNGYTIGLVFVDRFHLEDSPNCTNDFIQITDRKENVATGVVYKTDQDKLCGRVLPPPFNSTSNKIEVLFRSNNAIQSDGFRARWNRNCGGTLFLSKEIQYLTSPGWPVAYENNLSCDYKFLAPDGVYFIIEFTSFELEKSVNCRFDSVTISSPDYGDPSTLCGKKIPKKQRFDSHSELRFKTDSSVPKQGFELKYYIDECGGEITEPTDIRSPSLEENGDYHNYLNCTWTIRAPPGKAVVVRFESFDLESYGRFSCRYDYIAIYNTSTIDENSKPEKFCGIMSDEPLFKRSESGSMIISFITDHSIGRKGFHAKVFFSNGIAAGCGGNITLNSQPQVFKTQRGPMYEAFEDCHWVVRAPSDNFIKLSITSMDLKNSNSTNGNKTKCSGDFLEVYDGDNQYAELIDVYCGINTQSTFVVSSSNKMWIRLVTDGSLNGNGVIATLQSFPTPCGKQRLIAGNQTESLTSPGFSSSTYSPGLRCHWYLSTPITNYNLKWFTIHFEHFDLESSENCNDEKLMIIDKNSRNYIDEGFGYDYLYLDGDEPVHTWTGSQVTEKTYSYCGNRIPHDFYSTGERLEIRFISSQNPKSSHTGFNLTYSTNACNRSFTSEQGRILYEGTLNCWFTITAPAGYTISLYFISFQLYDTEACIDKALQIRDGNSSASVLAQLCGSELPSPIFSSGNQLSLHSWSNGQGGYISYDITYTTTNKGKGCGGKLYNSKGQFTSPLYPQPYRNASICTWEVSVPMAHVVKLEFEDFNTGSERTCATDYLEIFENYQDTLSSSKFCGPRPPSIYTANTHTIQVVYHTTANNGGSGWSIHFSAVRHV